MYPWKVALFLDISTAYVVYFVLAGAVQSVIPGQHFSLVQASAWVLEWTSSWLRLVVISSFLQNTHYIVVVSSVQQKEGA